ncbi:MAG: hypothetical protein AMXMBFR84_07050 [Candidatus Hydrogenedentota bacterium]
MLMWRTACCMAAITGHMLLTPLLYAQDTAYRVSAAKGPYFLIDSRVVEDRWMIDRFVVPLKRHSADPLIVKTGEWEGSGPHMGGSVLYDAEARLFRLWYTVFSRHNYDNKLPFSYNVCYAESDDGYTWRKPALGVFKHEADPANNYINLGTDKTQNIDVMLNPIPGRYPGKFIALHNQKGGLFVSHSDDGKSFVFDLDAPALSYHSDTHNNLVYDEGRDNWFLFCRPRAYAGDHKRRVSLQQSSDLKSWTHDRVILIPSEDERPEYYGMTVFRQNDLFFGMRQSYDRADQLLYPELVWSGDGVHWESLPDHGKFLDFGPPGAWDAGMILLAESPVPVGDELRFYYGGFAKPHNEADNPCGIGLATAERDRLAGVRPSGDEPGYVLTRPFIVTAQDTVRLNAIVGEEGSILAELRTDHNKPIEGYSLADCDTVESSGFAVPLTWKGKTLDTLEGQEVRIRFELRRASLFTYALK